MSTIRVGRHDYPEDIFADTRMSFGDHIEELRNHMIRAGIGLVICLVIGFVIDGLGYYMDVDEVGVGRPMMYLIQENVTIPVNEFQLARLEAYKEKVAEGRIKDIREAQPIRVQISTEGLREYFSPKENTEIPDLIETEIQMPQSDVYIAAKQAELDDGQGKRLSALSVQEPLIVYFKVSLLCGVVIASPYLFWQLWSFVGVGLYPHERKYIFTYLPFSLFLFLSGVLLCQFYVMPLAVRAMLSFNTWLDIDPDIRLSEWLNFAILLPLVFGVSFQTPLFMLFFERIGIFTTEDYVKRWRMAMFVMAGSAAMITPPDIVSMVSLCGPMFGLYIFGIWLCKLIPRPVDEFDTESADDVAV